MRTSDQKHIQRTSPVYLYCPTALISIYQIRVRVALISFKIIPVNGILRVMEETLLEFSHRYDEITMRSRTFKRICDTHNLSEKRVLDIGCGVGSHMQRFGPGSVGITSNPHEVTLGKEINRDIRLGNVELLAEAMPASEKFDVIWCNNIFEHLLSPHAFLVHLKTHAHPDTIIILGTPMVPTPSLLMKIKKFRGALASPHVNFFTAKTYELTTQFSGWDIQTITPYYTSSSLINSLIKPFMPHLYLVAKNNTDYRYPPKKLKEWEYDPHYQGLIKVMNPGYLKEKSN
jgi:SAM-dependent methyltransferase